MKIIWIALAGVALLAGSASGASRGGSIDLVAYSTPKDAYGQIISAFQKTSTGNGTSPEPCRDRQAVAASGPSSAATGSTVGT